MRYLYTIMFLFATYCLGAQNVALKTNLLYDAAATANLGLELGLGKRTTLDISGNYNGWYTDEAKNEKIRHFMVQPEFRVYFCEKFNGHFFGIHGIFGEYNINGEQWLLSSMAKLSTLRDLDTQNSRFQGDGYGGGISYGYALMLSNRFNLEFSVGAGYIYFDYDRYGAKKCAPYIESANQHYIGLTKLGVSLVYIIK